MAKKQIELSKERMGEIALMVLRKKVKEERISLDPQEVRRRIGNAAKELGISNEEAAAFMKAMIVPAFEEVLEAIKA